MSVAPTTYASGTQTATVTTEHVLKDTTVAGVFSFHVDTVNMLANDVLELRIYRMVLTAGTRRVLVFGQFFGAQPTDDVIKETIVVGNDITDTGALEFTLKQTFGTSRTFPWKVLQY